MDVWLDGLTGNSWSRRF